MSGMNLLDMLSAAQGGNAISNLGQQVGLNQSQANAAVKALLPALSSGLKRNVAQQGGLDALVGALQSGNHSQYLDDAAHLANPQTTSAGNAILGHILGSKDVSRAVAGRAAAQTGIGEGALKQMLPLLATMAMGSLGKQAQQPSMANILGAALSGGQSSGGGMLGGLLGAALGGGRKQQPAQNPLMAMLDADGDGSAMDDVFDMLTKR